MIEQATTSTNSEKIAKVFKNPDVLDLLSAQIEELAQMNSQFAWSLTAQKLCLFIYFHTKKAPQSQLPFGYDSGQGMYAIRITKGFPISGLRVYVLNNSCNPQIFDCRDLTNDILGDDWSYKYRLQNIFNNIANFQSRLKTRNNNFLSMQRTGQFRLGDLFDIHQLKKFSALNLFQDQTKGEGPLVGTTQTHMLTFKLVPQKQKNAEKIYQLSRACQLQCIGQIYHCKTSGEVIVTFCKYVKVQSFNEVQKISKKYIFQDTEQFLRNILKYIGNFQKMDIDLTLSKKNQADPSLEKAAKKVLQSKKLEDSLKNATQEKTRTEMKSQLIQVYHKIVEHFSERANAYYLIFVAKLNKISNPK